MDAVCDAVCEVHFASIILGKETRCYRTSL